MSHFNDMMLNEGHYDSVMWHCLDINCLDKLVRIIKHSTSTLIYKYTPCSHFANGFICVRLHFNWILQLNSRNLIKLALVYFQLNVLLASIAYNSYSLQLIPMFSEEYTFPTVMGNDWEGLGGCLTFSTHLCSSSSGKGRWQLRRWSWQQ